MIILQGTNQEVAIEMCPDEETGCTNCDNCGGSITH